MAIIRVVFEVIVMLCVIGVWLVILLALAGFERKEEK